MKLAISLLTVMTLLATEVAAQVNANGRTFEQEREVFLGYLEAAKEGEAEGQYRTAVAYFTGFGLNERDHIESSYWLQKAADQDHKQALNRMAWHYRNGIGVIQSVPEAEKMYKRAYIEGVIGAAIPLAAIYRAGEGTPVDDGGQGHVKENHGEAIRWARIAAEAGMPPGMNILGELYEEGIGVRQDFGQALFWFEKAAQEDHALALFNASTIYRNQDIEYTDMEKGIDYLKRAADKGHARAMIDLALSYANGTGVEQSYQNALDWYSRAAAKNRKSAVQLARAYEDGVFGGRDPMRAYKWYYIAEKSGEVSGIVGRIAMRDEISRVQIIAMEAEGNQWLKDNVLPRRATN